MPAALPPERQTQNSPTALTIGLFDWCRHQESNSGPPDYKSGALPTELYRLTEIPYGTFSDKLVPAPRVELGTP